MRPEDTPLRQTPLWLVLAFTSLPLTPAAAQTPDGTAEAQTPAAAAGDDEPPPSMALLEFVALFETEDGQWMDPEAIPLTLDVDDTSDGPTAAPPTRQERAPTPAHRRELRHAR
ncbi:MAG: hypothetical protein AAF358_13135 [Pseudomonadota bacterium]